MARKREIITPHGSIKKIAKDTSLSELTVRLALRGITDTANADLIRQRALKFYGGVIAK